MAHSESYGPDVPTIVYFKFNSLDVLANDNGGFNLGAVWGKGTRSMTLPANCTTLPLTQFDNVT